MGEFSAVTDARTASTAAFFPGEGGAPEAPPGPRVRAAVLGIVLPLAILFPLTGLSLIVALALERAVSLLRRRFALT